MSAVEDRQGHLKRVILTKETFANAPAKEEAAAPNNNEPRLQKAGGEAERFAERHGVEVSDVEAYENAMKQGNVQSAHWALGNIRRTMRIKNKALKLSEFKDVFAEVRNELYHTVALLVKLSGVGEVFGGRLCEVIFIHEVVAGVVWWVDIYHLHLVEICFLQTLQHIEVVALNVEVLRGVEVHALFTAWAQGGIHGSIGSKDSLALVGPSELIAFLTTRDNCIRQFLLQFLKVHLVLDDSRTIIVIAHDCLRHAVREQLRYLLYIVLHAVGALHF